MIALFLRDVPERIRAGRQALADGDLDAVGRAGHSLKSSSAQLGALRMQRVAREIEARADAGDTVPLAPLLDELDAAFAEHARWLRLAIPEPS
jgi:HPt (histidine-containing phosphotransfer) domain-containing protein